MEKEGGDPGITNARGEKVRCGREKKGETKLVPQHGGKRW